MTRKELAGILNLLRQGELSSEDVLERLSAGPFSNGDLGFANLDFHRSLRNGFGEVVFGESKTVAEITNIVRTLASGRRTVLVTRLDESKMRECERDLSSELPLRSDLRAGTLTAFPKLARLRAENKGAPFVAVVSAGTSDLRVAGEAVETLIAHEVVFEMYNDLGVAGLQRILSKIPEIRLASAVIVCAGMEGALPSVIGGLVDTPVFAVPTSVGYGASFGGVAALLGMLNSCASGVTVCNIDNGFGAAMAACRVLQNLQRAEVSRRE